MPDRDQLPESPRENVGARRLGRAGFLGVVGAGVATLFYGKTISHATSRLTNPISDATGLTRIIPSSGWRIYTVADSMPSVRPRDLAAPHRRTGRAARSSSPTSELLALPKAEQISTFHCVTGWVVKQVHWGGVRFHDLLAAARPLPAGPRAALRLGREALRRLPGDAPGRGSAT